MSMITGCPACGTMFRVVPDQLKISDGWVRCGQCGEVFDATGNLRPDARPGAAPRADPGAPEPVPQADADSPGPAPAAPAAELPQAEPATHPATWQAAGAPDTGDASRIGSEADSPAATAIAMPLAAADRAASVHPAPPSVPASPAAADSRFGSQGGTGDEVEDEPDPAFHLRSSELEEVSFVRQARRKAVWRRPLVRSLLLFAMLGLGLMLAVQVAVHERDRLAAAQPQLRPLLEQVCERLACTIGAPRRIEAIMIDSSGFTRLRPDVYRLSFTLKNQSRAPVALPALQLTLTDPQEQAVVQRVLLPGDLGAAPASSLAAAAEWSASIALAVSSGDPASGRIAGYRLLAFYP